MVTIYKFPFRILIHLFTLPKTPIIILYFIEEKRNRIAPFLLFIILTFKLHLDFYNARVNLVLILFHLDF